MQYKIKIKDEENNLIEISEDEIVEIKYEIGLVENSNYANNRSILQMEIIGKIISNIDENKNEDMSLYKKNKENIIGLINWAESYLEKSDYRNIEVFVDLGSDKNIEYNFNNMFVYNFMQEFSIEKGIGLFTLSLRQKFLQKDKIEVR